MRHISRFVKLAIIFAAALLCLTGCMNGPEKAADKAMKCLMNEDIRGVIDTFHLTESEKKEYTELFEKAVAPELRDCGGVQKYKIVESNIDEEKQKATVTVHVIYGNNSEEDLDFEFVNVNGKWLQEIDK